MKQLLFTITLLIGLSAQAKTIDYNIFAGEKTVKSTSSLKLKAFDFKLVTVTASKTVKATKCNTGPINDRAQTGLCKEVTLVKADVAQAIYSYRPYGTTDRHGEVTNGKFVEFVKFNVALSELSETEIAILKNARRSERKAMLRNLYNVTVDRDGSFHTVTFQ